MGLQDRDYVGGGGPFGPRRWWHKWQSWLAIAVTIVTLAGATVWLIRDARFLVPRFGPDPGSLIVNINTASDAQLQTVPGIGPVRAAQIVAGRPWESVDALVRIHGIGPNQIESMRPFLTVSVKTQKRSR